MGEKFPLDWIELVLVQADRRKDRLTIHGILPDDDVAAPEVLEVVGKSTQRLDGGVRVPTRLILDPVTFYRPLPQQVFDVDGQLAAHGITSSASSTFTRTLPVSRSCMRPVFTSDR